MPILSYVSSFRAASPQPLGLDGTTQSHQGCSGDGAPERNLVFSDKCHPSCSTRQDGSIGVGGPAHTNTWTWGVPNDSSKGMCGSAGTAGWKEVGPEKPSHPSIRTAPISGPAERHLESSGEPRSQSPLGLRPHAAVTQGSPMALSPPDICQGTQDCALAGKSGSNLARHPKSPVRSSHTGRVAWAPAPRDRSRPAARSCHDH